MICRLGSLAALLLGVLSSIAHAQEEGGSSEGSSGDSGGGFSVAGIIKTLEDHVVPWAAQIAGALFALFVGWIVAGWAARKVRKVVEKRELDATLGNFFANMVRYLIIIGVVLGVLGVFGINTSSFAAVIAAAGLAIGLAFQGTLSNFAAGVMLLVFRPIKVGDYVEIGSESGTVVEVELFFCELKTPDAKRKIVPNSQIWGSAITNYSSYPERRVGVDVGTDYSANTDEVRAILQKVAENVEGGLSEPEPAVFLKALGGSSIDWQVRVWCKTEDFWAVHERTTRDVKKALDEAGVGIPFPQMDVHFDGEAVEAMGK
jgi:small conductance mechanosensitive channel